MEAGIAYAHVRTRSRLMCYLPSQRKWQLGGCTKEVMRFVGAQDFLVSHAHDMAGDQILKPAPDVAWDAGLKCQVAPGSFEVLGFRIDPGSSEVPEFRILVVLSCWDAVHQYRQRLHQRQIPTIGKES